MSILHFFILLNNIPLCGCTTHYLSWSTHQLIDIMVVSTLGMACLSTWAISREDGSVLRLPPVGRITSSKDQGSRCLPHWAEALSLWVSTTVETLLGNRLGSLLSLHFTLKVDREATRGVSWAKETRQFPEGKCGGREIQGPTPRSWEHFWNPRREDVDHLKDVQWDMKV